MEERDFQHADGVIKYLHLDHGHTENIIFLHVVLPTTKIMPTTLHKRFLNATISTPLIYPDLKLQFSSSSLQYRKLSRMDCFVDRKSRT